MHRLTDHTADLALEIEAPNREEFYREALLAVIELLTGVEMGSNSGNYTGRNSSILRMAASGRDDEQLLVNLLNELLYQCQTRGWLPNGVGALKFSEEFALTADIIGRSGRASELAREIKAATWHNLKVVRMGDLWKAVVVLDV